ncbi:FecR family protein [Nibrella saemangeumensis]
MNDDLLGKYLAGEANAAESERVRQWLGEDEVYQQEFDKFERIWETAGQVNREAPVDTDAAWLKMKSRMTATSTPASTAQAPTVPAPATPPPPFPSVETPPTDETIVRPLSGRGATPWRTYWRAAAMIALVCTLGWLAFQKYLNKPEAEVVAIQSVKTTNQKQERTLPDGTKVTLNRGSRLSFPQAFASDSREVTLSGEAFFEVTPDPARPFRIKAQGTTVQVLGTSFSVRAYDENVKVAVRTGKVEFTAKKKAVTLVKNETAAFDAAEDTIRKLPKLDVNLFSYKTGRLEFKNDRLSDVVQTLNDVYQADVQLANPGLQNCLLTVTFDDESLDHVLNVTAETLGLRVRREGSRAIFEGKGCAQ